MPPPTRRRRCLAAEAELQAADAPAGLDRVEIGHARGIGLAGIDGAVRLELLAIECEEPPQLRQRRRVVVDAEIDLGKILSRRLQQRRRLPAAAVATRRLTASSAATRRSARGPVAAAKPAKVASTTRPLASMLPATLTPAPPRSPAHSTQCRPVQAA